MVPSDGGRYKLYSRKFNRTGWQWDCCISVIRQASNNKHSAEKNQSYDRGGSCNDCNTKQQLRLFVFGKRPKWVWGGGVIVLNFLNFVLEACVGP